MLILLTTIIMIQFFAIVIQGKINRKLDRRINKLEKHC